MGKNNQRRRADPVGWGGGAARVGEVLGPPPGVSFPTLQAKKFLAPQPQGQGAGLDEAALFTVPGFMTAREVRGFVEAGEAMGFQQQGSGGAAAGEAFRDNGRVAVQDPALAQQLWESGIKQVFAGLEVELEGRRASGLNPNIRMYRYEKGQRFGKHIDEEVDLGGGAVTGYTLLVYLSGAEAGLSGGETAFYDDYSRLVAKVPPVAGTALLHLHGEDCLEHEGMEVREGSKYILRSDVVFE